MAIPIRQGLWDLCRGLCDQERVGWDPALTSFLQNNLIPSDVFIDVGAHVEYLCQDRGPCRVRLGRVDVEGAELFVLRGMKRIMREMRPAIVPELHPQLLEDVGTPFDTVLALFKGL